MRASRICGFAVAALGGTLAVWSAGSHAQYGSDPGTDTRAYVAPMASYASFDEDTFDPEDTAGAQLSLGKTFVKQVAMELYAFHFSDIDIRDGNGEADNSGFGFNVLLFPVRDIFPVFGIVGIGEGMLDTDSGFDEDSEFVDLGIGFLLPLADRLDVRGEYRFRSSDVQYPTGGELDVRTNLISLGVQIPIGAR